MTLIKQRADAFQKESSRQLEADLAELRRENASLRDQLARSHIDAIESRTGGTGDTAPRHTPQSTVSRERPAFSLQQGAGVSEAAASGKRRSPSNDVPSAGLEAHSENALPTQTTPSVVGGTSLSINDASSAVKADALGTLPKERAEGEHQEDKAPSAWTASTAITATSMGRPAGAQLLSVGQAKDDERTSVTETTAGVPQRWSRNVRPHNTRADSRSRILGRKSVRPTIPGEKISEEPDEPPRVKYKALKNQLRAQKEGVFADAAAMKDRVREALAKPEYNVADFYWEEGWCQAIARHQFFEYTTLAVIAVNALWIAIDVDHNDKDLLLDADPIFQIAEHSFCAFFTFEWTVRFLSFKEKRNALRDAWFCFDTVLVIIMVLETWIFSFVFLAVGHAQSGGMNTSVLKLIRLVRLTRMARMAKLLRAVPELIILIKGIWVAARSVFFTLVLLVLIIYVFAIILRQVTDDTIIGREYYASIPKAMQSLLLDGVLPDQAVLVRANGDSHFFLGFFLLLFILLSSLTVMNMLVGVLCEVVSVVSSVEKEQLTVNYVKQRLHSMFMDTNLDQDGSQSISKLEFESMLTNREAAEIIQDLGVDVVGLVDFADHLFEEEDTELSFADFMELVLQLRGSNNCTVKDMVDLRKFVVTELSAAEHRTMECFCHIMNFDTQKLQDFLAGNTSHKEDNSIQDATTEVDHAPLSLSAQRFQPDPQSNSAQSVTELPGSVGLA